MKVRNRFIFEKIEHHFEKGGKLYVLHAAYDSVSTLFFVPKTITKKGSHIRDGIDLKRTMTVVILALIPSLLFGMFNIGVQHYLSYGENGGTWQQVIASMGIWPLFLYGLIKMLPILVVTYGLGIIIEVFFAQVRGHSVSEGVFVTGMLLPLIVPPDIPLWQLATAMTFSIVIGKEIFGGTGMNIINPALLARAFLFFSYSPEMSGDTVWIAEKADAFSGATPLAHAASGNIDAMPSVLDMFLGFIPGSVGETSTLLIIIGALVLLFTGVGSGRIMLFTLIGATVTGLLFNIWGANEYMNIPFWEHYIMGGFAFGLVFMMTDPVTAAQTAKGKVIFGLIGGSLMIISRILNPAFAEGVMLVILFMNIMAPLIDHFVVASNIKMRKRRAKKIQISVN